MVSQHTNLFFAYPKITREFPLFEYLFFTTFGYYRYFHADATHGDIEMIKSVLFNLTPYTTHYTTTEHNFRCNIFGSQFSSIYIVQLLRGSEMKWEMLPPIRMTMIIIHLS